MTDIAALLPHAGAMVMIDAVVRWDADHIQCSSRTHRSAANPLRRDGRLPAICGVEYGLQAAAIHGALLDGGTSQKPGYVARLRDVVLSVPFLDEAAFDTLSIIARLEHAEPGGMLYAIQLTDDAGTELVRARAAIALPAAR